MTEIHTAPALKLLLHSKTGVQVWDYGAQFNDLWSMTSTTQGHAIVVWADTPADPHVRPVATEQHLTPFDWAIAACSLFQDLRVTVVDLRGKERNQTDDAAADERKEAPCSALRWLRTQREGCVPWLRRLVVSELVDLDLEDLREHLIEKPKTTDPVVRPRDVLRALPVCRVDLTRDASHHAIANLVGPLLLLRKVAAATPDSSANHREALRQLLVAAGCISKPKPSDDADEELAGRRSSITNIAGNSGGELRIVLCDDQWYHGWLDWLCEQTGATANEQGAQPVPGLPDDKPRLAARAGNGVSIWVSSGPKWLITKLDALSSSQPPLRRQLHLTSENETHREILLLDLRLFTGEEKNQSAFLKALRPLHEKFCGDTTQPMAAVPIECTDGSEPTAEVLSLLPRTLALADPLLPVILFSSTGRRDVIKMLSDYPSIITSFAKPRLLGDGMNNLRTSTEEAFDRAIEEAVRFVRRRRAVGELQAARRRVASSLACVSPPQTTFKHVGIYIDESGNASFPHEPFVVAAVVALYPDEAAATAFDAALRPAAQRWLKGSDPACSPQHRSAVAAAIAQTANTYGIALRGVALARGPSMPKKPTFWHTATWADLALDRTHRDLLRRIVAASLLYAVQTAEIDAQAECSVLADVRSLPLQDLGCPEPTPDDLFRFGLREFTNRRGDRLWALLDPSGVYPIVNEVFSENRSRVGTLRIVDARATMELAAHGHPLVEWADHLAHTVLCAEKRWKKHPEPWAQTLLQGAGFRSTYDEPMEQLLGLARRAEDEPFELLKDGVAEKAVAAHAACSDKTPGGLADRCLAFIAEKLDAWRV